MVDYMAKKNLMIDDAYFEKEFYPKYVADIKSYQKYKELEELVKSKNLCILFSYAKEEKRSYIQYEVGFEILDRNGDLVSVSKESKNWDCLYNLLSFFPVVNYNKLKKNLVVFEIDAEQIDEEITPLIEYLRSITVF